MKIGIVTQPLIGNYGGIIQNFALQQVLIRLGHKPVTLDYLYGYSGLHWFYEQFKQIINKCIGRKKEWTIPYAPKRNNKVINNFIDKYIRHTPSFWNDYKADLVNKYGLQAIIVGSDQVWRPKYNPKLHSSFLTFTNHHNVKRIAYAASFGTDKLDYNDSQRKIADKQLVKFDAVSVREQSAIILVHELGADATQVLDPTLLFGRDGFEKSLQLKQLKQEDLLGTYILDNSDTISYELNRLQNLAGCSEIINISESTEDIGPKEWIEMIMNSHFFITDSFHGTVFCILFHVPFYTVLNKERGADRFISLLQPLGLTDRIKNTYSEIKDMNDGIDWDHVDNMIANQRTQSLNFLIESLS